VRTMLARPLAIAKWRGVEPDVILLSNKANFGPVLVI
jgi:hypothetical protein